MIKFTFTPISPGAIKELLGKKLISDIETSLFFEILITVLLINRGVPSLGGY